MCGVYCNNKKKRLENVFRYLEVPPPLSSHINVVPHFSTAQLHLQKQTNNRQKHNTNKNVLFKNGQLYWIELLIMKGNRIIPM